MGIPAGRRPEGRHGMNEILIWLGVLLAGLALGAFFFGGLWWTVRAGLKSKQPALLFMGSLILRSAVVLTGFYFVGAGSALRILVCLGGFLIARAVVKRLTANDEEVADIMNKKRGSNATES